MLGGRKDLLMNVSVVGNLYVAEVPGVEVVGKLLLFAVKELKSYMGHYISTCCNSSTLCSGELGNNINTELDLLQVPSDEARRFGHLGSY